MVTWKFCLINKRGSIHCCWNSLISNCHSVASILTTGPEVEDPSQKCRAVIGLTDSGNGLRAGAWIEQTQPRWISPPPNKFLLITFSGLVAVAVAATLVPKCFSSFRLYENTGASYDSPCICLPCLHVTLSFDRFARKPRAARISRGLYMRSVNIRN